MPLTVEDLKRNNVSLEQAKFMLAQIETQERASAPKRGLIPAIGRSIGAVMKAAPKVILEGKVPETETSDISKALQELELKRQYSELYPSMSEKLSQMELEAIGKRRAGQARPAASLPTSEAIVPTPGAIGQGDIPPMYIEIPTGEYDKYTGIEKVKTEKNPAYDRWEKANDPKFLAEQGEIKRVSDEKSRQITDRTKDTLNDIAEIEKGIKGSEPGGSYFGLRSMVPTIPGTSRYKWNIYLNKILAGKVVDLMTEMKNASKTGATGFGQLNKDELKVLQDGATALKAGLAPEDAQEILNNMKAVLNKVLSGSGSTDNTFPSEGGQEPSLEELIAEKQSRGR
mgnify:CR=1 FL=1